VVKLLFEVVVTTSS